MKRYINTRTEEGVETIDEVDSDDFKTIKEYRFEVTRLCFEYKMAGTACWASSRATKEWREAKCANK